MISDGLTVDYSELTNGQNKCNDNQKEENDSAQEKEEKKKKEANQSKSQMRNGSWLRNTAPREWSTLGMKRENVEHE